MKNFLYIKKNNCKVIFYFSILLLCIFTAVSFFSINLFNNYYMGDVDSFIQRDMGREIFNGAVPFKDIFEMKGTAIFLITGILNLLGDPIAFFLFSVFILYITYITIFKLCKIYFDSHISLLSIFIINLYFITLFNGKLITNESIGFYAMPIYSYFVYKYFCEKYKLIDVYLFGLFSAILFDLKLNLTILPLLVIIKIIIKKNFYKSFLFSITIFLIGFFTYFLPLIIYFIHNNALFDWFYCSILFNFTSYIGVLTLPDKIYTGMWFLSNPLLLLCFIYMFLYVIHRFVFNIHKNNFLIYNIDTFYYYILFCLTFVFNVMLSGYRFSHYALPLIPLIAFPYASLIKCIKSKLIIITLFLFTFFLFILFAYKTYLYKKTDIIAYNSDKGVIDYMNKNTDLNVPVIICGDNCFRLNYYIKNVKNFKYRYNNSNILFKDETIKYIANNNPYIIYYKIHRTDYYNFKKIVTKDKKIIYQDNKYEVYK